jgi:hypothetical protein
MTIRSLYHLIAVFLIFSCSTSERESDSAADDLTPEQQEVSDLEDRVIEVHDEVMPQLGTLVSLKEQLEAKNKELASSGDAGAKDQVIINSLVIENLDQAHEGMMDWMRKFEPVDLEGDPEANVKYLQQELDKISSVKQQVNNAISGAEDLIN